MMGVLFCSILIGNVLVGTIGGWWDTMSHAGFFLPHVALAAGSMIAMLLIARPAVRLLAPHGTVP